MQPDSDWSPEKLVRYGGMHLTLAQPGLGNRWANAHLINPGDRVETLCGLAATGYLTERGHRAKCPRCDLIFTGEILPGPPATQPDDARPDPGA